PGTALRHGQIYESNGKMLAAAVRAAGGTPTLLRSVADDVEQFHATLRPELAGTDLIVTSGGVSAGAYEVVKDAFTEQGVDFYRVAMQPGGPQGCGRFSGVPVITLPGNPVSTGISFEIFVRPAMRSAMGFARPRRQAIRARLSEEVTSLPGRSQFRRGLFDYAAGTVALHGGPGSHLLTALATSNVLVVLEPDDVHLPAGAEVEVLPLP
ncbi:MAG: molybdopterin molybdotransferase MoeA, partial [Sciscionella sp.]